MASRTLGAGLDIHLAVTAGDSADQLRDLRSWLIEEPELRGRVRMLERPASEGALGPIADGLQIAFGAGGAAATLASVVVAWLGNRGGEVTVKIKRGEAEAEVEVTAKGVKSLDMAETRALISHMAGLLGDPEGAATGDA
ncbi:hypothetical protein GCM10022226_83220 [Sphaerisporangium flaviroseum]|uniref:Uncharacterized protein n=1 Tax=Sphaerisporangium flaviroseum TaxID=509199 RepID=A0ABP7JL12_9ACTN